MENDLLLTLSRYTETVGDYLDLNRGIVVIPKTHANVLIEKQRINYQDHRVQFLAWLLNVGRTPSKAKGAYHTVYSTAYRTATFDKWRWEHCGGYSMPPTEAEARAFVELLAYDYEESEDIVFIEPVSDSRTRRTSS